MLPPNPSCLFQPLPPHIFLSANSNILNVFSRHFCPITGCLSHQKRSWSGPFLYIPDVSFTLPLALSSLGLPILIIASTEATCLSGISINHSDNQVSTEQITLHIYFKLLHPGEQCSGRVNPGLCPRLWQPEPGNGEVSPGSTRKNRGVKQRDGLLSANTTSYQYGSMGHICSGVASLKIKADACKSSLPGARHRGSADMPPASQSQRLFQRAPRYVWELDACPSGRLFNTSRRVGEVAASERGPGVP